MMEEGVLKACCADAYANPLVAMILGEAWHPGGLDLTRRLGDMMALSSKDTVADVAAGAGASACLIARQFGARVLGVDYGKTQVISAARRAAREGLSDRVTFCEGDAEALPWDDGTVDAVICECSLCTFPSPERAVAEWFRVLKPGGRVGITDVTRTGDLPEELNTLAGWVSCLAGAKPFHAYSALLTSKGFAVRMSEDRSSDLAALVDRIGRAVLSWLDFQGPEGTSYSAEQVREILRHAQQAVASGQLGYGLVVASRP